MCWFQEPYIGNKWWHMGVHKPVPSLDFFFFFKHKFFLWQVGEFSLVCKEGREGGKQKKKKKEGCLFRDLLCTCRSFTTFLQDIPAKKRKDLKRRKEEEGEREKAGICRMYLWEKKKGGERADEEMALITHRSGHYQSAERRYKTITNGDHQSVHQ